MSNEFVNWKGKFFAGVELYQHVQVCIIFFIYILHCYVTFVYCKLLFLFTVTNCNDPGVPINGTRLGNGLSYLSDPLFFDCDDGFTLIGSNVRRCQENGEFSGTQPVCKPISGK